MGIPTVSEQIAYVANLNKKELSNLYEPGVGIDSILTKIQQAE